MNENYSKKIIRTGWILIGAGIVFGLIWMSQKKDENIALISAPVKGDVYEIGKDENYFTIYKVARVDIDSVFI